MRHNQGPQVQRLRLQPGTHQAGEAAVPSTWRCPGAGYSTSKPCYPLHRSGGGNHSSEATPSILQWGLHGQGEQLKMADTTCVEGPNKTTHDILTQLNKHFDAFWRKLEHKLYQSAPQQTAALPLQKLPVYLQQEDQCHGCRPATNTTQTVSQRGRRMQQRAKQQKKRNLPTPATNECLPKRNKIL
ncbi:Hypothetical predicted protein [Pelobates cultripes]|uniref:Uncharacterized protein n=1 Tax=Pelobates cultripes TaxID=61616 RepID=A0AAD1SSZ5_PELCU|nr:Hypothetical predicted protein [Pelobates cultripes]